MSRKIFESVQMKKPGRSGFDLTHQRKFGATPGWLYPAYVQEINPGDSFKVRSEMLVRMAPTISPIMHNVDIFMHYFFVPYRIVWNQWEEFITGGEDGLQVPPMPELALDGAACAPGQLPDFLGCPSPLNQTPTQLLGVSDLDFRAYYEIYNEYYRDQNLDPKIDIEAIGNAPLLAQRRWEKDYFTSGLPWPQKGPAVDLPVDWTPEYKDTSNVYMNDGSDLPVNIDLITGTVDPTLLEARGEASARIENLKQNQSAIGVSIEELRRASRLQEWLEKAARGGSRYRERIASSFGVWTSDARLQRPEYLGGGKQPLVISEVLNQTGDPTEGAPAQGDMAGHGISVGGNNGFKRKFEEHGVVLGIFSILPRTGYYQGVRKGLLRRDKFDYYWPEFANIGEQEIANMELYFNWEDNTNNPLAFAYQQRFAEYKYACNSVHGGFRSTLNHWHWDRHFDSPPQLNSEFVAATPDQRIFAVTEGENFYVQIHNSVKAIRPMPFFSDPRL